MRILALNWRDIEHPSSGGSERYVHEITRRWAAAGHDVTLFCSATRSLPADATVDEVHVVRRGNRVSVYREARSFITASEWDLIVESVNTRPFFAHRIAPHVPSVAIFHQLARDVWFYEAPLPIAMAGRFVLEPLWLRRYRDATTLAVSPSTRHDLIRMGFRRVGLAPNGLTPAPALATVKEDRPTFLFVGRLQPVKRPLHALRAFEIIRRAMPQAQLWIIGDGPLAPRLSRRASEGITLFGRVDEQTKWELMARAHLLLVPSVREGWGLVVSEAAAVGTAAVGYRVPGLVDSIVHGTTGWLCDPSPESLARTAMDAFGRAKEFGMSAQRRVGALSWDRTAEDILQAGAAHADFRRRVTTPKKKLG